MKKIEVLILNIDFTQDSEYLLTTTKVLHNQGIGATTTDFWSVPTYIAEAIINKDVHVIVLSSLPKSNTDRFSETINELNRLNVNNLPVIAIGETIVNKSLSITGATNETISTYIQQLTDLDEQVLDKPKKIAHIGIAVKNIVETLPFYNDSLGLQLEGVEEVKSEGVKVAFLKIGESKIELLEPLSSSSPVQRFLDSRGEGIHHIALEVDSIKERLQQLKESGIRLINEEPKQGAGDSQIAFVHPSSANGVLFELCQYTEEAK